MLLKLEFKKIKTYDNGGHNLRSKSDENRGPKDRIVVKKKRWIVLEVPFIGVLIFLLFQLVIRGIGTLLCSRQRNYNSQHHLVPEHVEVDNLSNGYPSKCYTHCHVTASSAPDRDPTDRSVMCEQLREQIQNILDIMNTVTTRQREQEALDEHDRAYIREWRVMASILDRLFFWLYLIAIVLSVAFLFPWR